MSNDDQRETWVSQAKHNALLEGLIVSQASQEDSEGYIAGDIDSDELVKLTRERFGLQGGS